MAARNFIGEAIAEVQTGGMHALAPDAVGLSNSLGAGCGHWNDFEAEVVKEPLHLFADASPLGDNEALCHGAGRDEQAARIS